MELIPEESSTEMGASNAGQTDCNFSRIHPNPPPKKIKIVAKFSHLRMCVLHFVGFSVSWILFCWIFFLFVGFLIL